MKNSQKLTDFISGFAALMELYNKAVHQGCFVECVVLSATAIDGLLRIGLILKHQLLHRNTDLNEKLLYQEDDAKVINEREVYKKACKNDIIKKDIYDSLEELYKKRNKVVHRYVISRITTEDVLNIAIKYDELMCKVNNIVIELENEQIRLGTGMTKSGGEEDIMEDLANIAIGKHGSQSFANALRNYT